METELSGGSVSTQDDTPQEFSFAKYLDTICPYYMNYGMTWDEFWYESIDRLQGYWQKHQFAVEQRNQELWLQGMYIYEAVCDVSPILHAFAKKGAKPHPYPSRPYAISEKQIQQEREEKERKLAEKGKRFMEALMQSTNKRFGEQPQAPQ